MPRPREFAALDLIVEEPGLTDSADWREMVRQLVVANEAAAAGREVLDVAAKGDDAPDRSDDPAAADPREVRLDAAFPAAVRVGGAVAAPCTRRGNCNVNVKSGLSVDWRAGPVAGTP